MTRTSSTGSATPQSRNPLIYALSGVVCLGGASAMSFAEQPELHQQLIEVRVDSPKFVSSGDAVVTHGYLDAFLIERVPESERGMLLASPDRVGRLLEGLIREQAFFERALRAGVLDQPETQQLLNRVLVSRVAGIYRDHHLSAVELDDYEAQARELYLTERGLFRAPEKVDVLHLLVLVEPSRTEHEAMRRILEVHDLLLSGAEPDAIIEANSEDPTYPENQGLLSGIIASDLVAPVAAVVSGLEPGEWSAPVRSQFGWHLVRLEARHEGVVPSWEEARSRATQIARERHLQVALERLFREVQDNPAIFSEGAVAEMRARYSVPAEHSFGAGEISEQMTD